MAITTSGTVSGFVYNQRKVIDHALRRAGRAPQKASAEDIQVAQEAIFTITSEWINAQFPLWTREYTMLPVAIGGSSVPCPVGTVDVFHAYWRALNCWRGTTATLTTGLNAATLFAGQPNADVTIAGPNPGVVVNFGSATQINQIGVLLGGSVSFTAALEVQTSTDGVTWTTVLTLPSTTFSPQVWSYFEIDPAISTQYVQIIAPVSTAWTVNQFNIGLPNFSDVEIGPLNIDDYYNLPDRLFQSERPNSAYLDRQITQPILKIWPTVNTDGFYNGTVGALMRRYIQDPGSLYNNVEVPQRWLEALQWRLAATLIYELPDEDQSQQSQASYFTLMAKQQRIQAIEAKATKAEMLAWSEERTRGPVRLAPNISGYTR